MKQEENIGGREKRVKRGREENSCKMHWEDFDLKFLPET